VCRFILGCSEKPMMFTKTQAAFTLSAMKLFDQHPRVYFWTFTRKRVDHDWVSMQAWSDMFRLLWTWHGTNLFGLRVVECHKTHGLHFHALLATRMSVHIARRAGKRFGFGRIHVCKADRGSILYLCKYLSKERNLLKGCRSWATVGGFKGTPVRNIEIDSIFHRNLKILSQGKKVSYLFARSVYKETMLWGHVRNWQKSKQQPKRVYHIGCRDYQPKHKPETDARFIDTYPTKLLFPNRSERGWEKLVQK